MDLMSNPPSCRRIAAMLLLIASVLVAAPGHAQPVVLSAVDVDPGATKAAGETFAYRLTYNCSSTSGPCSGARVINLLPPEVQFVATVPATPTGDIAAVNVTPDYLGTGRTRVEFVLIEPLPAGNSGDLLINVRFPNGSTPDGTVATSTADGVNLETVPGTFTAPPVDVTAVAAFRAQLTKNLQTSPANLDRPERYRLRVRVPNDPGVLDLTSVGPVTDTLPPGTVFDGATPAADCEPGCVGTTPATLTWSGACALPVEPGENCDIQVNVTFPGATFSSGTDVTNSFVADMTPLGEPIQTGVGPAQATHPVTAFVANPSMSLSKNIAGGAPNPPTFNQSFAYELRFENNGNVDLDNLTVIDDIPPEMVVDIVTSGAWNGATGTVTVSYATNLSGGFFALGSSPAGTNSTLPIPALGAGEYLTRLRWEFPTVTPDFAPAGASNRPRIVGRIIDPDNFGNPVAPGDSIENCVELSADYLAGPSAVIRGPFCRTFTLSGPFVQLNPGKDEVSGASPVAPGQSATWRLRVRSDDRSSDPVPLEHLVATDLLPADLEYDAWSFDDRGTGLPAPQSFEQIPDFAGTGRTLLRWTWNAASGSLPVGGEVWINLDTTVRDGVLAGGLANEFTLEHDAPGLAQRCSGSSLGDTLDYDGDFDTGETLCRNSASVTVAAIVQLVAAKTVQGVCDAGSTASSLGTLAGGAIDYRVRLQNVGTLPTEDLVLVDLLPSVGDTDVRSTNPRGSQWTPLLAAPIVPPAGAVVYYSTSGNPCRGEVGGPVTGCDAPGWTTVPPEPITAVRAFKLEFGDRAVAPFDKVEFGLTLTTPGDLPPTGEAFNSFAFQAERGDGLGSLAAEPAKVGIAMGSCEAASLGDFVWSDLDGNGIQDDGATGLNGVAVRLFDPGPDGAPASPDDVPLSVAITADGPGGEPGWYRFPGLAPGDYLVCVEPPATTRVTVRDAGGDDALDSDADPATACSPIVALAASEENADLDFGIEPTGLAAVGDYVWFDRNGDGMQNESPLDGANGVTVRLFADGGDGVADPGTDTEVAATATGDDIDGRPGYFEFDGLVPGADYFLLFELPVAATGFTAAGMGDAATGSDADPADGTTAVFSVAAGAVDRSFDAGLLSDTGSLVLGDQVWLDADDDGLFEPAAGEAGIDGVRLDLYFDANGDGEPTLGEHRATTVTNTDSGRAGRYRFSGLPVGDYLLLVSPSNFSGAGPLAGLASSSGNDPAPDPDDDFNGDDNGASLGALVVTRPVTLAPGAEPTTDDGDEDTNLTVDLGFSSFPPIPMFDYGDAPDVGQGAGSGDYNTLALDLGARHRIDGFGSPYLGDCVDADDGLQQNVASTADDAGIGSSVVGTCTGDDDEDGVNFSGTLIPGASASFVVTAAAGVNDCSLDGWVDWNGNGVFGDLGDEVVAASLTIPAGTSVTLTPSVPASAVSGTTYARFRCSTAGGLPPTGPAFDGEVEDYRVLVNSAPTFTAGDSVPLVLSEDDPAVSLSSVLAVDDPDTDQTLEWSVMSGPSNGTLAGFPTTAGAGIGVEPPGVTYAPGADANGSDSFEIEVSDGSAVDTVTVSVTIADAPDVLSVAVDDGVYAIGDVIGATVVFDEAVSVDTAGGVPTLGLDIGGTLRQSTYVSGSGTSVLRFEYTVVEADSDDGDGIAIAANALALNGAMITDADGDGNTADIGHAGIAGSGEIVDATRPTLDAVTRSSPVDPTTNADVLVFQTVFSEAVASIDAADFDAAGATLGDATSVSGSAATWQVTVSGGDLADFEGSVGLALSATEDITDVAGNRLAAPAAPDPNQTYALDNTAPIVAIDALITDDPTPPLSGTVDDAGAALELIVDGQVATPTNNGDGTWTLADDVLAPLPFGLYDVAVTATDPVGNVGTDGTVDELLVTPDTDGDGVDNSIEDGAPNDGDGNDDGIPDADQAAVASLPTVTGRGYMTLTLADSCTGFQQVEAVDPSTLPPDPNGAAYPFGLVAFSLPCETAQVEITYHQGAPAVFLGSVYRKYGPTTPGDPATIDWYDFSDFAALSGRTWTLELADGQLGDDTGDDGVIVDQGGPTAGDVLPVPLDSRWTLLLIVGLLLLTGGWRLLERRA